MSSCDWTSSPYKPSFALPLPPLGENARLSLARPSRPAVDEHRRGGICGSTLPHLGCNLGCMIDNRRRLLRRIPPAYPAGRFSVNGATHTWSSFFPTFVDYTLHTWRRPRVRLRLYAVGRALALVLNAPKTSAGRRCPLAIGPRVRLLFAHLLCLPPSGEITR